MKIKDLYGMLGAVGVVALGTVILSGSLLPGGNAFAETMQTEDVEISIQADEDEGADADDDADGATSDTYTVANFGNDEKFFTCVKDKISGVGTDATSITKAQAQSLTKLSCTDEKEAEQISTTTGIELLTGLQELNISNQANITSIDLSANTALTDVYLHDNAKLATVKTAESYPKLTFFSLRGSQVSEIDISGMTELTALWLYNNKLTKVDTSKNTKITTITLSNNALTSVDLSKNTALEALYAYGNKIEYVDASKFNKSLVALYLDDDVLVRTNFVAVQIKAGSAYYAGAWVNDNMKNMFPAFINATGLYTGDTEITTKGAKYYGSGSNNCSASDASCIVFDADILNYQKYVQLKYIGKAADEADIEKGMDRTKQNYRLEINLEAWKEQAEGGDIKVPDTGASTGSTNAAIIAASLGALALVSGGAYLAVYTAKRAGHKVSFKK